MVQGHQGPISSREEGHKDDPWGASSGVGMGAGPLSKPETPKEFDGSNVGRLYLGPGSAKNESTGC